MKKILFFIVLSLLFGCATPVKNKREARLMPEQIAKQVLVRFFGDAWVQNPRGYFVSRSDQLLCGQDRAMSFSDINVVYFNGQNPGVVTVANNKWLKVLVPCSQIFYSTSPGNFSQEDIDDIVDALVSLGAQIND